ncbi:MAG: energy transducer TonB [Venatoribacter sp.]
MLRLLGFSLAAAGFTLGLFWVMQQMISGPGEKPETDASRTMVDFVRLKQDSRTELKERHKAEPPKLQQPQIPKQSVSQQNNQEAPALNINMPNVAMDMSISNSSMLGDAVVGLGFGDGDVIPLVRMNAQYPQRAIRQKIEGFVTARLEINAQGSVDKVEIVEAQPRGIFEREAIRALYRYKFKPKMEDGKPQAQVATQTIEFKLGDD